VDRVGVERRELADRWAHLLARRAHRTPEQEPPTATTTASVTEASLFRVELRVTWAGTDAHRVT
jgi:hypothetical protein